jgi:hypothetical protein
MTDDDSNVVPLRPAAPSPEGWGKREQEALTIARLGALPELEYERCRLSAARGLGCRVTWLDRVIGRLRGTIEKYKQIPPARDGKAVGEGITFWPERGPPIIGFVVTTAHWQGRDWHYLVLADGNGSVVRSTPMSGEELAARQQRLGEATDCPISLS